MTEMETLTRAYQLAGRKDDEDGYVSLARIRTEFIRLQDGVAISQPKGDDNGKTTK